VRIELTWRALQVPIRTQGPLGLFRLSMHILCTFVALRYRSSGHCATDHRENCAQIGAMCALYGW